MWNHRDSVRFAGCVLVLVLAACGDDDSAPATDHEPVNQLPGSKIDSGTPIAGMSAATAGSSAGGRSGSGGTSASGSGGMSGAASAGTHANAGADASSDHDGSTSDAGDAAEQDLVDAATQDASDEQPDTGTGEPDDDGGTGEDDDNNDWPPPPATEALAALPGELATGICDAIERCMGPTLREIVLDGADCVTRTTAEIEDGDFVFMQASIDAGRMAFDPDAVAQCVDDYGTLGCDLVASRPPASCNDAVHGEVALGDACVIDDDCAGNTFCDRSASCPGACRALLAQGSDCDRNDQCRDGLECLAGKCGSSALATEDCAGGVAPECHLGLLCIGADDSMSMPGECRAKSSLFVQSEGEGCDAARGTWCEEGLACVVDIIDNNGSPALTQVCSQRVSSGDACHTSLVPQQCPAGEYCPADLAPAVTAECVARPASGEPCGTFNICASDSTCDQGTCRATRRRIGVACAQDGDCLTQRCVADHCAALDRCRLDPEPPDPTCGDTMCNGAEDCDSCALDCGECPVNPSCGDGSCSGGETCSSCDDDCGGCPPACGDGTCNGTETCSSCDDDCGVCPPACGDGTCNGTETCSSCDDDCGACPPVCGDHACNGTETCSSCAGDCGVCPPVCGDDHCDSGEDCESCDDDCGVCPAPYSGPCDDASDCAPSQTCKQQTGPFGDPYGYCAEGCVTTNDCSGPSGQRVCGTDARCALQCSVFECLLLNQDRCCPQGMDCIDSICSWIR